MAIFSRQLKKLTIANPTMGVLDASGGKSARDIDADGQLLGQLFASLVVSTDVPPKCDVLFIYGHIEPDGRIANSHLGLRENDSRRKGIDRRICFRERRK